jgi:hypothetical protein
LSSNLLIKLSRIFIGINFVGFSFASVVVYLSEGIVGDFVANIVMALIFLSLTIALSKNRLNAVVIAAVISFLQIFSITTSSFSYSIPNNFGVILSSDINNIDYTINIYAFLLAVIFSSAAYSIKKTNRVAGGL